MPVGGDEPVAEPELVAVPDGVWLLEPLTEGMPVGDEDEERDADCVELSEHESEEEELARLEVDNEDDAVGEEDNIEELDDDAVGEAELHTASLMGSHEAS